MDIFRPIKEGGGEGNIVPQLWVKLTTLHYFKDAFIQKDKIRIVE